MTDRDIKRGEEVINIHKTCDICEKRLNMFDFTKIIDGKRYCKNCMQWREENESPKIKIKNFFNPTIDKITLTLVLYTTMLSYQLVHYGEGFKNIGFAKFMSELGYILNFPILFFEKIFPKQGGVLFFLLLISTLLILAWNYLLACEIYNLYTKITGTPKK